MSISLVGYVSFRQADIAFCRVSGSPACTQPSSRGSPGGDFGVPAGTLMVSVGGDGGARCPPWRQRRPGRDGKGGPTPAGGRGGGPPAPPPRTPRPPPP